MIDSGVGLPIGKKISLKSFIQVDDENGGFITLQYKTLNFDKNELMRISIDGQSLLLENQDSDNFRIF